MTKDKHTEGRWVRAAVRIKFPPYWPEHPQFWFAQVETQFATRGINRQRTKFDCIVSSLAHEITTEVWDLILKPPDDTPYDKLKEQLVKLLLPQNRITYNNCFMPRSWGIGTVTVFEENATAIGRQGLRYRQCFPTWIFSTTFTAKCTDGFASTPDTWSLDNLAQLADKIPCNCCC